MTETISDLGFGERYLGDHEEIADDEVTWTGHTVRSRGKATISDLGSTLELKRDNCQGNVSDFKGNTSQKWRFQDV